LKIKSKEIKENSLAEIIIEIDAEKMENAKTDAYKKNRNSISVPGFRRGKAPRKIIERMLGATVFFSDAIEALMPEVFEFVDAETDMKTVGKPNVSDIDFKEDDPDIGAEVTIELSLYPEVELGEYKGLTAVRPKVTVSADEINEQIEALRIRNARMENVDRAAKSGDLVNLNFEGFVDNEPFDGGKAENYELELGSNSFIPGFEDKMIGMKAGEERDIDLTFPDEYQKDLAGKPVIFKVKVNEVKEKILPVLDDEFAKDISEFDTLKEYKADLKKKRHQEKQNESDTVFENALLNQIVDSITVDVPDVMISELHEVLVNRQIRQMSAYGIDPERYLQMTGQTVEEFSAGIRVQAEMQVKMNLALEKIAELENVEISAEDVENEYVEAANNMGVEVDEIKKSTKEEVVINDLKMRRAVKIIAENAVATDEEEKPADKSVGDAALDVPSEKKPAAKKTTAKKPAAKKTAEEKPVGDVAPDVPSEKKPAAKKTTTKKPADKSVGDAALGVPSEEKPATKKTTTKKTAKKPVGDATLDEPSAKKPTAKKSTPKNP
jgi:trigger factor